MAHGCCDYDTPKTLVIKGTGVGCFHKILLLFIMCFFIGYVFIVQKAYQETEHVISTVTTKVKGFAFTNSCDLDLQFLDEADYLFPPQGGHSFFVMTNLIVTPNQTLSHCPELPSESTTCNDECDCTEGQTDLNGNGIQTGQCVNYSDTIKTCEVLSWCPLQKDTEPPEDALLAGAENFTVLIQNSVMYPKFNFSSTNIKPHLNSSYLKTCEFHDKTHPDCPVFRLKYIVSEAGEDFQVMAVKGGIIGILVDWTCNLDWGLTKCYPKYSFRRLDKKDFVNHLEPGFNFRFANGEKTRTLIRAYGIRFDVVVFGTAGKFGMVPTVVSLAAAFIFLIMAASCSDCLLVTCTKKRELYRKHKYTYLSKDGDTDPIMMGTGYGTR